MTAFRKRELILYYGVAYLITAILETIWFTILIGSWTFRDIMLNFSMWGIIWLVSLFAYPMFFTDAQSSNLALSPYLALMGYVIIIVMYYLTYRFHKKNIETRVGKKLSFNKLIDLYFPVKKTSTKESADEKQPTEKSDGISESES